MPDTSRRSYGFILLSLILLLAGCREHGPVAPLMLQLEKGRSYHVWTVTEQSLIGDGAMTQTIGLGTLYTVEDVDPSGLATLRVTYDSASFRQKGSEGETASSSGDSSITADPSAIGYMSIVGKSFLMKIDRTGHVQGIEGADSIRNAIAEKLGGSNNFTIGLVDAGLRKVFGDSSLKQSAEQMMAVYPAAPVAVGDSWSSSIDMAAGFPMKLENEYTLESRTGGIATIAVHSTIRSNSDQSRGRGLMDLQYDIEGKQKGTIKVEEKSGWVMEGDITQDFSGTMRFGGDSLTAGHKPIPLSVRATVTTRSVAR